MKNFAPHDIGRAGCVEITRSLEYCFHYIRNVIAILRVKKSISNVLRHSLFDHTSGDLP